MSDAIYWTGSIFLWLFFTGIGIPPVPEEAGILYAASINALHSEVRWWMAWPACGLGIIAADCVLYGVGRWWGPKLFEYRWVQKVLDAEKRIRLEGHFANHGMKLLLAARFLPPLRTGVFLIAGATRFSFLKFMVADLIYATVGVGAFFFCGAWILDLAHKFQGPVMFVAALAVLLYGLYLYYKLLWRRQPAGTPTAPMSILQGPGGSVPDGKGAKDMAAAPAAEQEAKDALGE